MKAVVGPETAKATTVNSLTAPVPGLAGGSWTPIADYPGGASGYGMNSAAAASYNGKVYVVGGWAGGAVDLTDAYSFDPTTGTWTKLADMPIGLQYPSAQFIGGTLYVTGGWDAGGLNTHTYAYNPSANTWTRLADIPAGVAAAGSAVIDGDLYVIGGCQGACAPMSTAVYSYDPGNNVWTQEPDYPQEVGYISCGGLTTEIVCAGGLNGGGSLNLTYSYTPGDATWTPRANMPVDAWAAGFTVANGRLDVLGGMVQNSSFSTNQNEAYDPTSDTWSPLPNSPDITFKQAAACGIYEVGGEDMSNKVLATAITCPGTTSAAVATTPWGGCPPRPRSPSPPGRASR